MSEDQEAYDAGTGELVDEPLSVQATAAIVKPKYWQRVEAIEGVGGPDYELAFFNAQSEIASMVEANAVNPAFKSRYATLAVLLSTVRPILTKHRLTIKQFPGRIHRLGLDGGVKQTFLPICTKITHVDTGQAEQFTWEMPLLKLDPGAIGSASTFAKRYCISGIFGIATVDDDAAAALIRNNIEKSHGDDVMDSLLLQIKEAKTTTDLVKWLKMNREGIEVFSEEKTDKLRDAYDKRKEALTEAEASSAQLDIERDAIAALDGRKGKK